MAVAATGVSTHHDAANLINTTPKNNTERDNTLLLEKGGMIPSYSPTTSSVRQSGKKRSSKKSLLEMLEKNEDGHNISILGDLNQQEIQHHNPSSTTGISRACTSSSNDRITPKTKSSRGTTNYTHQDSITPNTSYSPLDYRPDTNPQKQSTAKKHGGAVTDGDENEEVEGEDDDTTMLKSYVDQWATKELAAEPTEVDQQQQHSGILKGSSRNGNQEKTTTTRKRERRGEELMDDPSSSVVSSSWDSEHNNADYHDDSDNGLVVEEGGRRGFEGDCKNHSTENNTIGAPAVMKSNQFFDDDIKDDGIHRGEKLDVLTNTKEQLEVEYGCLALLMQDLEHKNQLQKSMQASGAVSEGRNTHVSLPVPLHTTLNNQATRSMATVEVDDDAPTIQRQLQLEYGRLAVLKDELKRKMKMMNGMEKKVMRGDPYTSHDDDSIRPSLTSSATAKGVGGQCENEKLAREYSQLASLRQELERKMMQSQKIDVAQANQLMTLPTTSKNMACRDDDIELGEMIYQQRMAEQLAGPFEHRYVDEEEDESITDHERYARRRKEMYPPTRDDIMKYDDIHPEKIRRMRPSSSGASKRKKKRKRRFVETITRVIHEESEEEGSSSTGGRHSLNYQYDSPRKYRIRNEDDYYYDDDDISLGERKHKGKRSSDYRKRYPKSLPPAGFRAPKSRGSRKKHSPVRSNRVSKSQSSMLESFH